MDEEDLNCPVCLESYNQGLNTPKMMPCLHTLCASCIYQFTTSSSAKQDSNPGTVDNPSNTTKLSNTQHTGTQSERQHPQLRRVSGHNFHTARETQNTRLLSVASQLSSCPSFPNKPKSSEAFLRRPKTRPPLSSKVGVAPSSCEPQIPRGVVVQCPLCRSEVSTSNLQTNRYVLAHMRDLARLTLSSAGVSASYTPSAPKEEFWCEDCAKVVTSSCSSHHRVMPIEERVETQTAIVDSLKMEVESQLSQHTAHLQNFDDMMKTAYHTLNKASRCSWRVNQELEVLRNSLKQQSAVSGTHCLKETMEELKKKEADLKQLRERVAEENLLKNSEVSVDVKEETNQVIIRTANPSLALIVTIASKPTDI